jgi:hypothetical protein
MSLVESSIVWINDSMFEPNLSVVFKATSVTVAVTFESNLTDPTDTLPE